MLAICAAIQVLGHWYETSAGERVDGVGLLDLTTSPQQRRTIGEVVSQPLLTGLTERLTGFENHRGGTVLGSEAHPLARVISGAGNREGCCPASSAISPRWTCRRSTFYAANGSQHPAACSVSRGESARESR